MSDSAMAPALTIQQVASMLQVTEQTIKAAIARQELRAFRVGRQWRIAREDLAAYTGSTQMGQSVPWLTSAQVSEQIGKSHSQARRLMAAGTIASVRQGGRWITTPESVRAYLERT